MGRYLKTMLYPPALVCTLVVAWMSIAAFTPTTYPVFDVLAFPNVDPTGAAVSNTGIQQAFTKASNGGLIRFPCGVFKLSAQPSVTIAAGKHVTVQGSGADCTTIYMTGGVNGPLFTYGDGYSSVDIADFTLTTDSVGSQNGIGFYFAGGGNASVSTNSNNVRNVYFRGQDFGGANADYWSSAFTATNVNNINFFGGACNGDTEAHGQERGICYSFNGTGTGSGPAQYGVVANFFGTNMNNCNIAVSYGDWVQGVVLGPGHNITACHYGITTPLTTSGVQSQLTVTGGGMAVDVCGVCVNNAALAGAQVIGESMSVSGTGIGILMKGFGWNVSGNVLNGGVNAVGLAIGSSGWGVAANNTISSFGSNINIQTGAVIQNVLVTNNSLNDFYNASNFTGTISNGSGGAGTILNVSAITPGNGPIVSGQIIVSGATLATVTFCGSGGCGTGGTGNYTVSVSQHVASPTVMESYQNLSIDYSFVSLGAGSTSVIIEDTLPRAATPGVGSFQIGTIPACSSVILHSRFHIIDATTPTYNGAYASGGANDAAVICAGSGPGWVTQ